MKETIYSYFMRQVEINPDVVAVFDMKVASQLKIYSSLNM